MSYLVSRKSHSQYGNVIQIIRDDIINNISSPWKAYLEAKSMRRLWMESDGGKVRILIDGQVMTLSQAEKWSYDEYKSLLKCHNCGQILQGEVFTHSYCNKELFCTQNCADKDYNYIMAERLNQDDSDCF